MSAFDPRRTCHGFLQLCTGLGALGSNSRMFKAEMAAQSFIMNDRGDLGNKAGAALEGYVAPQPGYGDYKTIPEANQKVDVHRAPKHPANKALELNRTDFYDGGASTNGR